MKIAIFSSASEIVQESNVVMAASIATYLHEIGDIDVVTGGCHGIPGFIVKKAKELGLKTIAYSPDEDEGLHASRHDNLDLKYFDTVKHFKGFTLRSIAMLQEVDGVLALNGRMGTLSEVTIALEEGKRVGVITNTGGIADELEEIVRMTQKDFSGQIFFSDDYEKVVDWLVKSAFKTH